MMIKKIEVLLPFSLAKYFRKVCELKYEEEPDYEEFRTSLLEELRI